MDDLAAAPSRMQKIAGTALLAALPLLMLSGFAPTAAMAAEPLLPAAERLFADGLKLAHSGDCVRARDKFTESYAADPAPGTLINWALCEEKLGRSATALELLRLADHALPQNHPKRAGMVRHMESLIKRAPILRLRMTSVLPPGATVHMDGAMLDTSLLARGVLGDPGPHVIEMRAPGREDRRYEVALAEGTTLEVTVEPGPPRTGASSGGAPNSGQRGDEPSSSSTTLGWALAGGGLTAIGVGAVTGLLASGKWTDVQANCDVAMKSCNNDAGVDAGKAGDTLSTVSTVAFIAGGASLAVGGYLLLTKKDAPASARLSAAAGPAMLGLRFGGEF
jgi:hypothetical protein